MAGAMTSLRQFSVLSVALRLMLAQAVGAVIGYGRARKKANAGLRTYMLVSIGAALTVLISIYEYEMLQGQWLPEVEMYGLKFDGSRFSASVVTGIGFLAAGTIIGVAHRQVSGLTSAIGLFACAVLGIAAGAGYYECVTINMALIIFTMEFMAPMERAFKRRLRNITICVEFDQARDIDRILRTIEGLNATIYDLEMERTEREGEHYPSAILTLRLSRENASHSAVLSSVAELDCVHGIQELIS